jgi:ferrous iron transport protein A
MNRTTSSMPLSHLAAGERARIIRIEGGYGIRKKLTDMGVLPGKEIRVHHGGGMGPRVVVVEETKIMLGRGVLHRIMVDPLDREGAGTGSQM